MKIVIATKNTGKIEGAKKAFTRYFDNVEIEGIPTFSEVGNQPVNEQIYLGCKNRVKNLKRYCKDNNIRPNYYLAIESGITNQLGTWFIINIAMIEDRNGFQSFGVSQGFPVPKKYVEKIIETELSTVTNEIFGEDKDRRNQKGGIGLLTQSEVTRIDLTYQAFIMALTQFINEDIWK